MRIFMGIVWFVVIFIVLYILYSVVLAVVISSGQQLTDYQSGMEAGLAFARDHATLLSLCRWGIFAVSVLAAAFGTWKRILPGTQYKKPKDATTT